LNSFIAVPFEVSGPGWRQSESEHRTAQATTPKLLRDKGSCILHGRRCRAAADSFFGTHAQSAESRNAVPDPSQPTIGRTSASQPGHVVSLSPSVSAIPADAFGRLALAFVPVRRASIPSGAGA
jgi:hypothetical protein